MSMSRRRTSACNARPPSSNRYLLVVNRCSTSKKSQGVHSAITAPLNAFRIPAINSGFENWRRPEHAKYCEDVHSSHAHRPALAFRDHSSPLLLASLSAESRRHRCAPISSSCSSSPAAHLANRNRGLKLLSAMVVSRSPVSLEGPRDTRRAVISSSPSHARSVRSRPLAPFSIGSVSSGQARAPKAAS